MALMSILYSLLNTWCSIFSPDEQASVYHVFCIFSLISLHVFGYACDLFFWERTRVNYRTIFRFSPTTLNKTGVFFISIGLMITAIGVMSVPLALKVVNFSPTEIDVFLGFLILLFLILLVFPFGFIQVVLRPVYSRVQVLFLDCFLADQLTSEIPLLMHLQTLSCLLISKLLNKNYNETCHSGMVYMIMTYVITSLPYIWRFMQCLSLWRGDPNVIHLGNIGKYVSANIAAVARVRYNTVDNHLWFFTVFVFIISMLANIYQVFWDVVIDWNLFNPNSRNLFLRDNLLLSSKAIYYVAVVSNFILRMLSILHFERWYIESRFIQLVLAAFEIIRRAIWNYFRLESLQSLDSDPPSDPSPVNDEDEEPLINMMP